MKRIAIALLLFTALPTVYARPRQQIQEQRQRNLPEGIRPRAAARRSLVEDSVFAFYVRRFQQDTEVTPDVFAKILPFIDRFLQDRFEISRRRTRALNQLRLAINGNGSDEELKRLVRDLDAADADFQVNQEKFLNNVDPLLNARQQAKIRILQNLADNQIRQALNAIQNQGGQRQAPAPVGPQD
jgi:hypothetical protein